jgi:4'-phosphopantetheinyl transferase EntD
MSDVRAAGSGLLPDAEQVGPSGGFILAPGFLDTAIAIRSCAIGVNGPETLHPDEAAGLSPQAVKIRQLEFAAGRACARVALESLGIGGRAVAAAEDRAPIWPEGAVGSISHTRKIAAAAVGLRSHGFAAIGLDIEEALPLEAELIREICTTDECAWLDGQRQADRGLLAKAIFCAKEAAYKCQYPVSRTLFGFETLHVDLDVPGRRFSARFLRDVPPFEAGYGLSGAIAVTANHFVAALFLRGPVG